MSHLNPEKLRILNWNLQKQTSARLHEELDALQTQSDLVALQEAVLEPHFLDSLNHHNEFSYTPGYKGLRHQTGVLTLTRLPALEFEQHLSREPWLRTPKAVHVTRHAFENHDEHLLLVNIHAVNFTLGDRAYREQLARLLPCLQAHKGPAIVTGDFNTWNRARKRCLQDFVAVCNLIEVGFDEDHRKRILQNPLDHMYIRGLEINSAHTQKTITSDHNPLLATFSLTS